MGIGLCTGRKCSYQSHRTQDIRHFLISSKTNPYSRAYYPPASPSATYFKREHLPISLLCSSLIAPGFSNLPHNLTTLSYERLHSSEKRILLTFGQIFKSCTQDSNAVLAVMANAIEQLKSIMPGMDTVFYQQDNAGCYHCGASIVCASIISCQQGVAIRRLDFSDAQGGKGACDCKAATIKVHMRAYLNSIHDIEGADQMYDAMTSSGGIPSLSVTLCDSVTAPQAGPYKIDGVSFLSNIAYTTEGIRVWRAYNIGPGKLIPGSEVNTANLPALEVNKSHPSMFTVVIKRQTPSSTEGLQDDTTEEVEAKSTSIFACPEEGCAKTFLRHSWLLRHLDCGKHQLVLERETLFDKAVLVPAST